MQRQQATGKRTRRRSAGHPRQGALKRRLIRAAAVLLGLLTFLALALTLVTKSYITPAYLESSIEKSINSDVEIGGVSVSIFSLPAQITLSDVSLSHKGQATGQRPPVKVEEITLRVSLWGLLRKHIDVTRINIRGAEIHTVYHEDGTTSIEKLFEAPAGKKGTRKIGQKGGGLNVFEQADFVATLGRLTLDDSKVHITLEEMGLRLQCRDVELELDSIEIDPRNLAKTNSANLKLYSHVQIDSTKGWKFGDLYLSGTSTAEIFNPVTGDAEPDVTGDFSLSKDSWLNTRIPFITSSWNHLAILEKVGIKVAQLPKKATFGRSEAIAAHYHQGKITVNKPLSIWVGDWELAALDRSWLQTQTDQHEIHGELLASKSASVHFHTIILKGAGLLPDQVQEIVTRDIEQRLFRDDRLLVGMKSTGDFSDPTIRPTGVIMDFAEAAKEAAKKIIKEKTGGILDGILGRDDDEKAPDN